MASSLDEVRGKIQSAAGGRDVRLIAVSKKQPFEKILDLYNQGQRDFGENYPQELAVKATEAKALGLNEIRWHLIGHLQSNKINQVLPWLDSFQALDSISLAEKISAKVQSLRGGNPLPVYIQVNIDQENSKGGFRVEEVEDALHSISKLTGLKIEGLMIIPDPENSRDAFQRVKRMNERMQTFSQGRLSMGMSADYELAILEGSTDVRVGTLLFGSRNSGSGI